MVSAIPIDGPGDVISPEELYSRVAAATKDWRFARWASTPDDPDREQRTIAAWEQMVVKARRIDGNKSNRGKKEAAEVLRLVELSDAVDAARTAARQSGDFMGGIKENLAFREALAPMATIHGLTSTQYDNELSPAQKALYAALWATEWQASRESREQRVCKEILEARETVREATRQEEFRQGSIPFILKDGTTVPMPMEEFAARFGDMVGLAGIAAMAHSAHMATARY